MSENSPNKVPNEEVDLGQLFKLIGSAFERLFKAIGSVLNKLFMAFVWLVFFVKKHILKIVIAGVVGFGVSHLEQKVSAPVYSAIVIVKQNYDTGENLYDLVNYYNSLIKHSDTTALSRALELPASKVNSIVELEIEPTTSENSKLKEYDGYLRQLDSTIASTIAYETFLENKKTYAYKFQKIEIKSNQVKDISQVFDKIIDKVNNTPYFKREQDKDLQELVNRELAIKESLKESQTLKETYKKVLETVIEKQEGSQTSITIEGADSKKETKEYELYQNDLSLRRELVDIERLKQDKQNIVEIVSSEFSNGIIDNTIELFGISLNKKVFSALGLIFVTFLILLGLEFFKYLDRIKNNS